MTSSSESLPHAPLDSLGDAFSGERSLFVFHYPAAANTPACAL
jgi:hypothetical protein